jgi:membrane-associated phospholipid phosphatase
MGNFKPFFYKLPQNIATSFRGYNLFWHVLAIILTFIIVVSGLDQFYFVHTRSSIIFVLAIPAALLGFIVPIFTPLTLFIVGLVRKNGKILNFGYALAQSALIAWIVSAAYKAVTGRAHPELFNATSNTLSDISREFHFGFLKGGVFWGWPSSHTMVAFAIAATAMTLYPKLKVKIWALLFALYVGIGVSLTIHWLSDFVAGAIIGTVVGITVGATFLMREILPNKVL